MTYIIYWHFERYKNMRVLFIVQGEGRGHLTQALTMEALLRREGHEVVGALVGKSSARELPAFFTRGMKALAAVVVLVAFVLVVLIHVSAFLSACGPARAQATACQVNYMVF